jgi:hypothetical protein
MFFLLFLLHCTLTQRWAFGNDEMVQVCKVCHISAESSSTSYWIQVLSVIRGPWQLKVHDSKLLWCLRVLQGGLYGVLCLLGESTLYNIVSVTKKLY